MDNTDNRVYEYSLEEIMGERFGKYSKYIIQDRAIPDVRDGLKPVQRRILFSMYKERNTYDKPYKKSARAVGDVMGKYHPHGDSSIYDALVVMTQDVTYLIFLLVYGVDGCLTICHRIMLNENLGEAHRKHVYQLMANELKIGHVKVSSLYMAIQLIVSLGFIYLCPNTVAAHWIYMVGAIAVLGVAYVLFKKKYYHLHEAYLASIKN